MCDFITLRLKRKDRRKVVKETLKNEMDNRPIFMTSRMTLFPIPETHIFSNYSHGGRGIWTVNYIGIQGFVPLLSHSLVE